MEMFALILGSLPSLTMEQMLVLVIFAVIGFAGFALHVFHSIAKK